MCHENIGLQGFVLVHSADYSTVNLPCFQRQQGDAGVVEASSGIQREEHRFSTRKKLGPPMAVHTSGRIHVGESLSSREIPNNLDLLGLPFYVQGIVLDFGVNPADHRRRVLPLVGVVGI